ncbi:TIGR02117 family protein [Aestuariibius sp. 2305UL40-4]|uniref:TIGR02117 family protein n=1 Tax=Aestuariibius violaceus TaxID=3234132 RepID=UPI00345E604A
MIYLRRALLGFLAVPLLWLLAAIPGAVIPGAKAPVAPAPQDRQIYVATGLIHNDIILPATPEIRRRFAFAEAAGVPVGWDEVNWIVVGWGARDFYTKTRFWNDLALGPTLKGIVGDEGILRVDVAGTLETTPQLRPLAVSDEQLDRLLDAVLADFAQGPDGQPIAHPVRGFTPFDRFFLAEGQFNALFTCNSWVGARLRDAGLPLGAWTPTPYALTLSLWWHGHLNGDV